MAAGLLEPKNVFWSNVWASGVSKQMTECETISIVILAPDTRHLKPILLKEKIDKLNPY